MSWQEEISEMLQEVNDAAVRFDVVQYLTDTEKGTAKTNIGMTTTASSISGDDYKITISW